MTDGMLLVNEYAIPTLAPSPAFGSITSVAQPLQIKLLSNAMQS